MSTKNLGKNWHFFQIAKIGIDLNKNKNWKQKTKFRKFLENQIAIIPIKTGGYELNNVTQIFRNEFCTKFG